MPEKRTWTREQRDAALSIYAEHGPAEAARRTGIPRKTIASWARRLGVQTRCLQNKTAAVQAMALSLDARKQALADGLLEDIARLRTSLFAPCVERKIVALPGKIVLRDDDGQADDDFASSWTVATLERGQPTFTEQKTIMTAVAIAVDKVQILTAGQANSAPVDEDVRGLAAEIIHLASRRAG